MEPVKLKVKWSSPESNRNARLFRDSHIQKLYQGGHFTLQDLAVRFNLSKTIIHRIIQRDPEYRPRLPGPTRRFADEATAAAFSEKKKKWLEIRNQKMKDDEEQRIALTIRHLEVKEMGRQERKKARSTSYLEANSHFLELYRSGLNLREIAERCGRKISRQRVEQILKRFPEYRELIAARRAETFKRNSEVEHICKMCGCPFLGKKEQTRCSRPCQGVLSYLAYHDPELAKREIRRKNREHTTAYYRKHLQGTEKMRLKAMLYNMRAKDKGTYKAWLEKRKRFEDGTGKLITEIVKETAAPTGLSR